MGGGDLAAIDIRNAQIGIPPPNSRLFSCAGAKQVNPSCVVGGNGHVARLFPGCREAIDQTSGVVVHDQELRNREGGGEYEVPRMLERPAEATGMGNAKLIAPVRSRGPTTQSRR